MPRLTTLRRNRRTYQVGHFITSSLFRPSAGFRPQYARWKTGALAYRYAALPAYRPFRCISQISPPPNAPLDSPLFFSRAHLPIYTLSRRPRLLYRLPFYRFSARCMYTLLISQSANEPSLLPRYQIYILKRPSWCVSPVGPPFNGLTSLTAIWPTRYSVNKRVNRICHLPFFLHFRPPHVYDASRPIGQWGRRFTILPFCQFCAQQGLRARAPWGRNSRPALPLLRPLSGLRCRRVPDLAVGRPPHSRGGEFAERDG